METIEFDSDVSSKTSSKDIDKLLDGYNDALDISDTSNDPEPDEKPDEKPKKKKSKVSVDYEEGEPDSITGDVITGLLFITLIDTLMPVIIGFVNDRVTKKPLTKTDLSRLQLTAKQKKELEPIANDVVKQWSITANPTTLLIISLIGIYGTNYIALKTSLENG